ncbi:hypothetical protein CBR_g38226 [Chara braunii]|uniref:WRC domain-containing protein n=1 Tax=Chara braunii TaxID=69332 RepID=A0A388LPT7_CHABU|nr:hypothetical protein CBR_g38226 [Chara braunii]|eukprot:GBG84255.1 hypothetical protein CBR_g38226 [Chara braunii]
MDDYPMHGLLVGFSLWGTLWHLLFPLGFWPTFTCRVGPTRGGTSTNPYTKEEEEKMAAILQEKKEKKEAKKKALKEEQAAKLKKIEEEMAKEKERIQKEEEEKLKEVEEEEEDETSLQRKRVQCSGSRDEEMEKRISEWVANLSLGEEEEVAMYISKGDQEAAMRTWEAEKDVVKRQALEDEKRMERKLAVMREKKRRVDAAAEAAEELEEIDSNLGPQPFPSPQTSVINYPALVAVISWCHEMLAMAAASAVLLCHAASPSCGLALIQHVLQQHDRIQPARMPQDCGVLISGPVPGHEDVSPFLYMHGYDRGGSCKETSPHKGECQSQEAACMHLELGSDCGSDADHSDPDHPANCPPDSVLRACYYVLLESGSNGLTSREMVSKMLDRGVRFQGKSAVLPRVQVANQLRSSPYFMEIEEGRFVLCSAVEEWGRGGEKWSAGKGTSLSEKAQVRTREGAVFHGKSKGGAPARDDPGWDSIREERGSDYPGAGSSEGMRCKGEARRAAGAAIQQPRAPDNGGPPPSPMSNDHSARALQKQTTSGQLERATAGPDGIAKVDEKLRLGLAHREWQLNEKTATKQSSKLYHAHGEQAAGCAGGFAQASSCGPMGESPNIDPSMLHMLSERLRARIQGNLTAGPAGGKRPRDDECQLWLADGQSSGTKGLRGRGYMEGGKVVGEKGDDMMRDAGADHEMTEASRRETSEEVGKKEGVGKERDNLEDMENVEDMAERVELERGNTDARATDMEIDENSIQMSTSQEEDGVQEERATTLLANIRDLSSLRPLQRMKVLMVTEADGNQCKRSDGKGWHCPLRARKGYSLCDHHLSKLRAKYVEGVVSGQKKKVYGSGNHTVKSNASCNAGESMKVGPRNGGALQGGNGASGYRPGGKYMAPTNGNESAQGEIESSDKEKGHDLTGAAGVPIPGVESVIVKRPRSGSAPRAVAAQVQGSGVADLGHGPAKKVHGAQEHGRSQARMERGVTRIAHSGMQGRSRNGTPSSRSAKLGEGGSGRASTSGANIGKSSAEKGTGLSVCVKQAWQCSGTWSKVMDNKREVLGVSEDGESFRRCQKTAGEGRLAQWQCMLPAVKGSQLCRKHLDRMRRFKTKRPLGAEKLMGEPVEDDRDSYNVDEGTKFLGKGSNCESGPPSRFRMHDGNAERRRKGRYCDGNAEPQTRCRDATAPERLIESRNAPDDTKAANRGGNRHNDREMPGKGRHRDPRAEQLAKGRGRDGKRETLYKGGVCDMSNEETRRKGPTGDASNVEMRGRGRNRFGNGKDRSYGDWCGPRDGQWNEGSGGSEKQEANTNTTKDGGGSGKPSVEADGTHRKELSRGEVFGRKAKPCHVVDYDSEREREQLFGGTRVVIEPPTLPRR